MMVQPGKGSAPTMGEWTFFEWPNVLCFFPAHRLRGMVAPSQCIRLTKAMPGKFVRRCLRIASTTLPQMWHSFFLWRRKSYIGMLDTVHHRGIRLSLGAFRTSPVESLYVEANEESLYRRAEYIDIRVSCFNVNTVRELFDTVPLCVNYFIHTKSWPLIFNLIVLNYLVIHIFSSHYRIHVFEYCIVLVLKCTSHQFSIFIVIFNYYIHSILYDLFIFYVYFLSM